ncbi:conserved hypothetical protein [Desulforamulus reducens MI-1]|uniref:Uncharacterized protein n=1 Tax=Desulforamulus reducens (strain ATCC BAA-1160 / DSM 100696 / MI-1) TaxID=349161 RepID=A4J8I1_DESRM|nr:hypothetical protein [Desulforamulus reducens]ABO51384.1 conserved hypothetical protein [Desulforamulus reducens MI-1]
MDEQKEKIIQTIKETAKDGGISCTAARKIASDYNVSPKVVGDICDELKIKLKACELGCF